MPYSKREVLLSPASTDGVYITATDTAALNLDIDVVVTKRLRLELVLVELEPGLRSIDLEPSELLGVRHGECFWLARGMRGTAGRRRCYRNCVLPLSSRAAIDVRGYR